MVFECQTKNKTDRQKNERVRWREIRVPHRRRLQTPTHIRPRCRATTPKKTAGISKLTSHSVHISSHGLLVPCVETIQSKIPVDMSASLLIKTLKEVGNARAIETPYYLQHCTKYCGCSLARDITTLTSPILHYISI